MRRMEDNVSKLQLPKLPKLPRSPRSGRHDANLPDLTQEGKRRLPELPALPDEVEERPREEDEVGVDAYGFDTRHGAVIGKAAPGRWFETGQQWGTIGGTCGNCGRKRRAENLRLMQRPFGRGEYWGCKEGC